MKVNLSGLKKLFGKEKEEKKQDGTPAKPTGSRKEREDALALDEEERPCGSSEELRARYAYFWENSPIKEKCILYEAFGGRGMTCSPHAIFKYLLTQAEFEDYLHVWVIDDFQDNAAQMEHYRNRKNVKFIQYQSLEYREYLATAKYLINNVSFPGYFTKREGQIYVDTWHGISLKTVGFDIPGGNVSAGNTAKNFLAADYLISANPFMTQIYQTAFKLDGLYEGTILEVGQPRNDGYFSTKKEEILKKLSEAGVKMEPGKKLILYAPTWKGSKYSDPDTSLEGYEKTLDIIRKNVDTDKYQVLVKPHQIVYYYIKKTKGLTGEYIPATVDTNELLSVTDVLISDYSSIYFDFLVSKKPILFFIPDLEEFLDYRGLYFGLDKLPGPIAQTYEELGSLVGDMDKAMEPYWEKYREEAAWACPRDDGSVCQRLADAVFRGKPSGYAVKCRANKKKKLLLYAGDFKESVGTFSFLALAQNLDYGKYDVTLLAEGNGGEEARMRISALPRSLRVLYRGLPFNAMPEESARHALLMQGKEAEVPHALYRRECRRLFGSAAFDCAVDLTGEKSLFAMLVSHMEGTRFHEFSRRLVNWGRIREELEEPAVLTSQSGRCYIAKLQEENAGEAFPADPNGNGAGSRFPSVLTVEVIPAPKAEKANYVCMNDEWDPEVMKNLLGSFSSVYQENKEACLFLIGTDGAKESLEGMAVKLQMEDAVVFTGALERPASFLGMCQYFVCPQGQEEAPGTLMAKTLGKTLLRGDCRTVIPYEFDAPKYNQECVKELEKWIENE